MLLFALWNISSTSCFIWKPVRLQEMWVHTQTPCQCLVSSAAHHWKNLAIHYFLGNISRKLPASYTPFPRIFHPCKDYQTMHLGAWEDKPFIFLFSILGALIFWVEEGWEPLKEGKRCYECGCISCSCFTSIYIWFKVLWKGYGVYLIETEGKSLLCLNCWLIAYSSTRNNSYYDS